jgi:hypothetical protein
MTKEILGQISDSHPHGEQTFLRGYSIATWLYGVAKMPEGVDLFDNHQRATWLADCAKHLIHALSGFARVSIYDVMTFSKGDDSFTPTHPGKEITEQLDEYLRCTSDVSNVAFFLDFWCLKNSEDSIVTEYPSLNDGYLFLWNNVNAGQKIEGEEYFITLSFNVANSIFAPVSLGKDNRALAALNGPRLRAFIERIEKHPDLKFREVDCDTEYVSWLRSHNLFDDHGFKMPEDVEAFDRLLKELNEAV